MAISLDGANGITTPSITSANAISLSSGSASAPALAPSDDTNTGIFFPAADTIAFAEGGVESMRINSDGKVLIGASSSDLSGTSQALVIGSGGLAVQFGGATGTYLKVNPGDANGVVELVADARTGNYPAMTFKTSATERARIDSSGNFIVGQSSNNFDATTLLGNGIGVSGNFSNTNGQVIRSTSTTSTQYFVGFLRGTSACGGISSATTNSTTYATSSDYRLKENIAPMSGALATVSQLKPCTYTWKEDGSAGQGFIAHELQAVVPECVVGEKDAVQNYTDEEGNEQTRPVYQGVDASFLVATLTAAIQELKAINDAQASRIETLESEVAALKSQNIN